jgi:uncharacterized membrane protein
MENPESTTSTNPWYASKRLYAALCSIILAGLAVSPVFEWRDALMAMLATAAAILSGASKYQEGKP